MPSVYKWRQAIDGGGFQNAFAVADNAIHPSYQNVAVCGADVAGFHRTTNRNNNVVWQTSYRGIKNMNQNCVTAMEFAKRSGSGGDGKLFVLTGRGGGNGFLISSDAGVSWAEGGLSIAGDGSTRGMNTAREIGRHICADNNGTHLWVAGKHSYGGSNKWGIAHSANDGSSFAGGAGFAMGTGKIPENSTVRFIVQHPSNDSVLYVGVDGKRTGSWSVADSAGGLYKITNAKTNTPTVQKLCGPTTPNFSTLNWMRDGVIVEEGGTPFLYFIAGKKTGTAEQTGGGLSFADVTVIKLNLTTEMASNLNIGSKGLDDDQQWTTIDGYRSGSNTVLWMGGWQGASHENTGVVVSRNGGVTWNNLIGTNYPTISKNFPSGREWWMFDAHDSFKFNKSNYDCAHIRVDPNNTSRVFSAGRGGLWMTTDDGNTWRPAMEGLGVSMAQASSYNPANKNQFSEGNVDWAAVISNDRFKYTSMPFGKNPPGDGGAANTVYAFHWTSRTLAMATGGRGSSGDASNGIVATCAAPTKTADFAAGVVNQGWQTGVSKANRPQVVGVMDGVDSTGKHTLIAIAQRNPSRPSDDAGSSGIWRKVITAEPSTGTWTRVSSAAFNQVMVKNSMQVSSYWPEGSSTLYAFDRKECKLWRSNDYGVNWSNVWTYSGTKSTIWAGYMAGGSATTIYVSVASHVYKFTNANTGSSLTPANVTPSGLDAPGAISVDEDGWVYVTRRFKDGTINNNKLYLSKDAGANWEVISTSDYEQRAVFPHSMTVMTEGTKKTILVDTWGNGTIIGEAGGTPPPTTYLKFNEDFENEGAPPAAGTAITSANSNFGVVSGSVTFSANSKQEDRSGSFVVGSTAGQVYGESETLEAKPQYALDFYFQVTAMPTITTRIAVLVDDAGVGFTGLQLTNTGKIVLQDGSAAVYTSSMTLATGQWYRIAVKWDANANNSQLKLWSGANLLASTPAEDSGVKAYTNETNTSKVRVGLLNASVTNAAVLFDDIMTKDDGLWPDRGTFDPTHAIVLGFIPMGIS